MRYNFKFLCTANVRQHLYHHEKIWGQFPQFHFCHPERQRRISLLKTRDSSATPQNDRYKNNDGITLIEVIVSIAVLGAVIVPVMTLFVMSAKINKESKKEHMSILAAQMYIEEIKATENIDTGKYVFNSETGSYERTVNQTNDEFGAEIKISPESNFLYIIEVLIMDDGEIINTLIGSKLLQ